MQLAVLMAGLQLLLAASYLQLISAQKDGDLRLIGPTSFQGTVAVYYKGVWGTICDDSWGFTDANVVCKQLGFERASRIWIRAHYGQGPGPIWIDQINCPVNAKSILNCNPNWGIHDCSKSEDAGVDCQRKFPAKPSSMPIRLMCPSCSRSGTCKMCPTKNHPRPGECSYQTSVEGIVFAYYKNEWRPVTGEGWDMNDAHVVCGELGYPLALSVPSLQTLCPNSNNQDLKLTLLKNVQCIGNERRLLDCYFPEFGPNNNPLMKVATVRCGFKPHHSCPQSSRAEIYRMRGTAVPWEGRVEARVNGVWGTICDRDWDLLDAGIVCRALGFGTAAKAHYGANYGRGVGRIHYNNLRCNGSERTLGGCTLKTTGSQAESCGHQADAGLKCNIPVVCPNPSLEKARLLDVPQVSQPRFRDSFVEVRGSRGWGLICGSSLPYKAANVICRETRYSFAGQIRSGSHTRYRGVRYTGVLSCTGDEASINDCRVSLVQTSSCSGKGGDSIVDCTSNLPDLVPDVSTVANSIRYYPYIDRSPMYYLQCALEEKCLSSSAANQPTSAIRQLLRFDSLTMNWGTADFLPNRRPEEWEFHSCHNHYHSFEAFIHYDLLDSVTRRKVAEGHKASFCLEDSVCRSGSRRFRCATGQQGISTNCGDLYGRNLDCQWIDVTDVKPGNYILRLQINPDQLVPESDTKNNQVECAIRILPRFVMQYISCTLSDH